MSTLDQLLENFTVITNHLLESADEIFSIPEEIEVTQELLDQCDYEACSFAYAAANMSMAAEFIASLYNVDVITDVDLINAYNKIDPVLEDPKLRIIQAQQTNNNGYIFRDIVQANVIAVKNRLSSYDEIEAPDDTISKESVITTLNATSLLMDWVYERNKPDFMTRFELGSAYNLALILRKELQTAENPIVHRVYSEELSVVQEFFQFNEFLAPKHGIILPNTPFHMDTAQWAWEQCNKPILSYFSTPGSSS